MSCFFFSLFKTIKVKNNGNEKLIYAGAFITEKFSFFYDDSKKNSNFYKTIIPVFWTITIYINGMSYMIHMLCAINKFILDTHTHTHVKIKFLYKNPYETNEKWLPTVQFILRFRVTCGSFYL